MDDKQLRAYAELPEDKLWRIVGAIDVARSPEGPSAVLEGVGEEELAQEGLLPSLPEIGDLAARGVEATVRLGERVQNALREGVCPQYVQLRDAGIIDIAFVIGRHVESALPEEWKGFAEIAAVALARLGLDRFCG